MSVKIFISKVNNGKGMKCEETEIPSYSQYENSPQYISEDQFLRFTVRDIVGDNKSEADLDKFILNTILVESVKLTQYYVKTSQNLTETIVNKSALTFFNVNVKTKKLDNLGYQIDISIPGEVNKELVPGVNQIIYKEVDKSEVVDTDTYIHLRNNEKLMGAYKVWNNSGVKGA
jgi:hypothetical protein